MATRRRANEELLPQRAAPRVTLAPIEPAPPEGRGRGRPRIVLDEDKVAAAASTGAPMTEIAAFFDVGIDVIRNNYRDAVAQGRERGKMSLRRKQMTVALNGNVSMLIWLGKQHLGQSEKVSQEVSGPGGGPIETMNTDANGQAILRKLAEIASRAQATDVDALIENREQVRITG